MSPAAVCMSRTSIEYGSHIFRFSLCSTADPNIDYGDPCGEGSWLPETWVLSGDLISYLVDGVWNPFGHGFDRIIE